MPLVLGVFPYSENEADQVVEQESDVTGISEMSAVGQKDHAPLETALHKIWLQGKSVV